MKSETIGIKLKMHVFAKITVLAIFLLRTNFSNVHSLAAQLFEIGHNSYCRDRKLGFPFYCITVMTNMCKNARRMPTKP